MAGKYQLSADAAEFTDFLPPPPKPQNFQVRLLKVSSLFDGRWAKGALFHKGFLAILDLQSCKVFENKLEEFKYAAAVFLDPDNLVITGGLVGSSPSNSSYIINSDSREFVPLAPMLTGRFLHSLLTAEGALYAIGGQQGSGVYLSECEQFREGQWEAIAPMKCPRSTFAAFSSSSGLFVAGGFSADGSLETSIEHYSFATSEWAIVITSELLLAGSGVSMVPNNSSEFLLIGGSSIESPKNQILKFDTSSNSLVLANSSLKRPRTKPFVFIDRDNSEICVIAGGSHDGEVLFKPEKTFAINLEAYDQLVTAFAS